VILFLDEVFNPSTIVGTGTRAACGKGMLAAVFSSTIPKELVVAEVVE